MACARHMTHNACRGDAGAAGDDPSSYMLDNTPIGGGMKTSATSHAQSEYYNTHMTPEKRAWAELPEVEVHVQVPAEPASGAPRRVQLVPRSNTGYLLPAGGRLRVDSRSDADRMIHVDRCMMIR